MVTRVYTALIRTHHITSRKKVATLKAAAKKLDCYALLRSGGIPGVMYVEGRDRPAVQQWVDVVHGLRYKDYQLVSAVSEAARNLDSDSDSGSDVGKFGLLEEVGTVREMGSIMQAKGLMDWWRAAMGFVKS